MDTTSLRTIMNYLASDLEYLPIFAAVLNAAMAPLLNLFESLGPRNSGDRSPRAVTVLWTQRNGDIKVEISWIVSAPPRPVSFKKHVPPTHRAEFDVNLEQGHDGFVRLKDCRSNDQCFFIPNSMELSLLITDL